MAEEQQGQMAPAGMERPIHQAITVAEAEAEVGAVRREAFRRQHGTEEWAAIIHQAAEAVQEGGSAPREPPEPMAEAEAEAEVISEWAVSEAPEVLGRNGILLTAQAAAQAAAAASTAVQPRAVEIREVSMAAADREAGTLPVPREPEASVRKE